MIKGYFVNILFFKKLQFLISFLFLVVSFQSYASETEKEHQTSTKEEKLNAGKLIIGHIVDAYEWHLADWGDTHLTIPLPVILIDEGKFHIFMSSKFHHGNESYKGYEIAQGGRYNGKIVRTIEDGTQIRPIDFSFTKNAFGLFISSALMLLIFFNVAKMYRRGNEVPKGMQALLEPVILFVRDEIAIKSIGKKHYRKFLPYLLTVFFFILLNNLFGLIPFFPFGANLTGNLAITGVLALFTFIITTFRGNKNYYRHIFNTLGVPWWLKVPLPLMPIIELVGVFTKPFVLMIRLFANIAAGHIVILGFVSLIFVFGQASALQGFIISPLSVILLVFMNVLELLVAFIQAYVFTLLSSIYFGMAVEESHH
ncbi:MAG: F0F1 ATP synthase subunit A [Lentimicrobiaceae bacterium]|jgi:F-type H+-transporting ATPase subunit a|nr:F0F1 ATP synthase subunit A [Lentimicrobiaceae bacterium]